MNLPNKADRILGPPLSRPGLQQVLHKIRQAEKDIVAGIYGVKNGEKKRQFYPFIGASSGCSELVPESRYLEQSHSFAYASFGPMETFVRPPRSGLFEGLVRRLFCIWHFTLAKEVSFFRKVYLLFPRISAA